MKFIHLTDTHLVEPGRRLHGLDPARNLEACVESIVSRHADAAFCVLTGDVADAAEPAAYAAVRAAVARLPMPVHLIPGNHDARAALIESFPDAPRDGDGFVQSAFRAQDATFVLLDTLEPAAGAGGAFCARRARWLAERLEEAGGGPVYLFMHHPPFPLGLPALDAVGLVDPEPFSRVVGASGNVRHIFFGHVHRPVSGQWRGVGFSSLYGTSHQTRLDLERRDFIAYTAEPPAYGVVLLNSDMTVVHTCHFLEDDANIKGASAGAEQ